MLEQRRIVRAVEAFMTSARAARDRLAKIPLTLERFRQSVLEAACSGSLTAGWRNSASGAATGRQLLEEIWESRRQRVVSAGPNKPRTGTLKKGSFEQNWELFVLPESWTWAIWNDLADWITYGFTRPMPHERAGIPIVTAKNIVCSRIDFSTVDYTTKAAFSALSSKDRPKRGEILVTKDGSIGRAAIVGTDVPFCINQSVAVVRFGGLSADPEYLRLAIESPWTQKLIEEGAKGSAIRHISITAFGKFPIPLPPLSEQREIVSRVSELFSLASSIERRVATAASRAERLPRVILSKGISGELVPTEAQLARADGRSYEAADVLLARISQAREEGGSTAAPVRRSRVRARAKTGRARRQR
jgi:type I restriction enzyme S subunit